MRKRSPDRCSVKKSDDPFAGQRSATQEALTRASLYHVCKRSPVLSNIDYKNTPTTVLEDLVSRYNAQTIREVPILFAKYVVKLCLQFVVNRYSGLRAYVDPSNMRVRIEDDEMLCLMRGKPSGPPNLLLVVTKNMLFSVIGHAVSRLKDDLLDKARRVDEEEGAQADARDNDAVTVPIVLDEKHQRPMYGLKVAEPPKKYELNDTVQSRPVPETNKHNGDAVNVASSSEAKSNDYFETNDAVSEASYSTFSASEPGGNGYPTKIVLSADEMKREEDEVVSALAADGNNADVNITDSRGNEHEPSAEITITPNIQSEDAEMVSFETVTVPREEDRGNCQLGSYPQNDRDSDAEAVQPVAKDQNAIRDRTDSMSSLSSAGSGKLSVLSYTLHGRERNQDTQSTVTHDEKNYSASEHGSENEQRKAFGYDHDSNYESDEDDNLASPNWKERSRIQPNFDYSAFDTQTVEKRDEEIYDNIDTGSDRSVNLYTETNAVAEALLSRRKTVKKGRGNTQRTQNKKAATNKTSAAKRKVNKRNGTVSRGKGSRKTNGKQKAVAVDRYEELFGSSENLHQDFNGRYDEDDTSSLRSRSPSIARSLLAESVSPLHASEENGVRSATRVVSEHVLRDRSPSPSLSVLAKRRSLSPTTSEPRPDSRVNETKLPNKQPTSVSLSPKPDEKEIIVLDDDADEAVETKLRITSNVTTKMLDTVSSEAASLQRSARPVGTDSAEEKRLLIGESIDTGSLERSTEETNAINHEIQRSRTDGYGSDASDDEHNYAAFGTKGKSSSKPSVIADVLLKPSEMQYKQRRDIDFFALVDRNESKIR